MGIRMKKVFATLFATALAGPALAHHPLAGAPMESFTHGVLSGVGHPILGFDHLFFIALVGIVAIFTGRALTAPLAFIATMIAGTVLMSSGFALPAVELMIVASLLVLGYIAASGRALSVGVAVSLFAVAGLFHGSAYGVSVAAQETAVGGSVLIGYLIGLAVTQYAIAIVAGLAMKKIWSVMSAGEMAPRLAGAVVAGMGMFLALETAEGAAFAALGLG